MSPSNTIFSPSSCSVDVASRFQNSTGSDGGRYMQPNKVLSLPVPALSHINSRLECEWSKMCLALTCSFTKMQIPPPLRHGVQEDRQVHPSAHGLSRRKRIKYSSHMNYLHVPGTYVNSCQCSWLCFSKFNYDSNIYIAYGSIIEFPSCKPSSLLIKVVL